MDFNDICNGSGLFAYTNRFGVRYGGYISSWLIAANKNSRIMRAVKYLLDDYWIHTNFLAHYFLFHIFFSLAAKRFSDEWSAVPVFTNDVPHILSGEITKPYTEKRFNQIRQMSNIHKLSRHIDADSIPKGSFYDVLINNRHGI